MSSSGAMAGGTPAHSKLQANLVAMLTAALKDKPCGVFTSDLRVRVVATDRSTCPDVTVICGKRAAAIDDPDAVTNPIVIAEVLSDSTEASDRGEKFAHYQRLDSLQEYVLVNQAAKRVEVFLRGAGVVWTFTPWTEGQDLTLESLGISLSVADIYLDPTA